MSASFLVQKTGTQRIAPTKPQNKQRQAQGGHYSGALELLGQLTKGHCVHRGCTRPAYFDLVYCIPSRHHGVESGPSTYTQIDPRDRTTTITHFLATCIFRGLAGSLGPSHFTTNSSPGLGSAFSSSEGSWSVSWSTAWWEYPSVIEQVLSSDDLALRALLVRLPAFAS